MAGMIDSALFGDLYSTAEMRAVWSETDLDALLDPIHYTGLASRFVDRVAPP